MKRRTYIKGQYSQVHLDDGKNVFFSVLPDRIKASEMRFMIPKRPFWEFIFPFYIRTSNEAWKSSEDILDLVLQSVEEAENISTLKECLDSKTNEALRVYIKTHGEEAQNISVDKVGTLAIKKMLNPKDLAEVEKIVHAYGKVIEDVHQEMVTKYPSRLFPVTKLPYSKDKIRKALNSAIQHTDDESMARNLRATLALLVCFVDDKEANQKNKHFLELFKGDRKKIEKDKRQERVVKVLHFEDDAFLTSMYEKKFSAEGFEYVSYENPSNDPVGIVLKENPDLIIMDIIMPIMNGFEATEILKSDRRTKLFPILGLCNLGQKADVNKAIDIGMSDYFVSANHTPSEIIKKVRELTNNKT